MNKKVVYYGFVGRENRERLEKKLVELFESKNTKTEIAEHELILIFTHSYSFGIYEKLISKYTNNLTESNTGNNLTGRKEFQIDNKFVIHLSEELDLKNVPGNVRHIFYDDALIGTFEKFMRKAGIKSESLETLVLTVDPIKNHAFNEWNSSNFCHLIKFYNLNVEYLLDTNAYETPFTKEQLSFYLNEIGGKLLCQPWSSGDSEFFKLNHLKIKSKQLFEFQLDSEISEITRDVPNEDVLVVYDRIFKKCFEGENTFKNSKEMTVKNLRSINAKIIVFCLSHRKYSENFFKYAEYVYCSITEITKEIQVFRIKQHLIEDSELDDAVDENLNEMAHFESLNYEILDDNLTKYIELSNLFGCDIHTTENYVFNFVQRAIDSQTVYNSETTQNTHKFKEFINKLDFGQSKDLYNIIDPYVYKSINATEYEIMACMCIKNGDIKTLETLFEKEANRLRLHSVYKNRTMLLWAAYYGRFDILKFLIKKGVNVHELEQDCDRNALQAVLLLNHNLEIAKFIINETNWGNKSDILQKMIRNERLELDCIDDLNRKDKFNATILHYVAAFGNLYYLEQLKSKFDNIADTYKISNDKKDFSCLCRAVYNGHLEMLINLIDLLKISLDQPNKELNDVLIVAVYACREDIIRWWLDNVKNYPSDLVNRRNLLHCLGRWYIENINVYGKAVELLISKGGDPRLLNLKGNNVLMELTTLSRSCCLETAKFWFNYFSKSDETFMYVKQKNKRKQSLVHLLAIHGNLEVLKSIKFRYNVDLFEHDDYGNTALMYASQNGFIEIVEWLLENHNSESIRTLMKHENSDNLNALDIAIANNSNEIANIFIKIYDIKPNLSIFDFSYIGLQNFHDLSDHLLYPLVLRNLSTTKMHYLKKNDDDLDSELYATLTRSDIFYDNLKTQDNTVSIKDLNRHFLNIYVVNRKDMEILGDGKKIRKQFLHFVNVYQHAKLDDLIKTGLIKLIVKYKDAYGATGVHLAATLGRVDIIIWLYLHNFNIHAVDKDGNTALYYAILNNHIYVCLTLFLLDLKILNNKKHHFLHNHYMNFKNSAQNVFLDVTLVKELIYGLKCLQIVNKESMPLHKEFKVAKSKLAIYIQNDKLLQPFKRLIVSPQQSVEATKQSVEASKQSVEETSGIHEIGNYKLD